MKGRLRTLSPARRYSLYFVGMLVLFSSALGVGALAAVMVGRHFAGTRVGPGEMSALEGGKPETTGMARSSRSSVAPPSTEGNPDKSDYEASFVHKATDANSRGDYTYISDPSIDKDPDAVVIVAVESTRKSGGTAKYGHHLGVWYEAGAGKWAIFNEDRSAVPPRSAFRIEVPRASQTFVHRADLLNTAGNYSYLDDRLTNGKPNAVLSITQNWNPGGGGGVYNDHPVATVYDAKVDKWAVYNLDGASIPNGAAFNVVASTDSNASAN